MSFDLPEFYARLDDRRARAGLTWKEVAAEAGVPASSLTRLKQGKGLDIHNISALAQWGRLKLNSFIREKL